MKKYTPSHEWIELHDTLGTVGISEFAIQELGEIVYIELPKIGAKVKCGQEIVIMESTKAAVDIYSPASGSIVEVNERLKANPSLLQSMNSNDLWLFKIKVTKLDEIDHLLSFYDYHKLIDKNKC